MIHVSLSLRLAAKPLRAPAAWLVPGNDPAAWMTHLAEGFPDAAGAALYMLPSSRQNRDPAGLLVIPANPAACHPSALLIPYGRVQNLYLPIDGLLWPPTAEQELAALLHCELNVFHPAIGLIGFSSADRLRLHQLLAPPARRSADWSLARPGLPPPTRLVAVLPLRPPQSQEILDQGQDDIGEKPLDEVPPAPQEPRTHPLVKAAAVAPLAAAAMVLQKLSAALRRKPSPGQGTQTPATPQRSAPAGPGLSDYFAGLASQAARAIHSLTPAQFTALASAMEARRNREIHRLLSLLQSNPDEGLRYALPLGGTPGRGLAAPADRLTPQNANFDLNRLGRSGPADVWNLSFELQERLRAHYRRLATRELQLGRHRRAAYIFAELLGDLASAANALQQGRHFREAAVLYRDRLGNTRAAADCLRDGGLILEAIPLYEELGLFERAGDLYTELAQPDLAAACYRKAVQQLLTQNDPLKAAALLESKLAAPREALAVLDSTWPAKPHASACLEEAFRLLARLRDFSEAQARVTRLRVASPSSRGLPQLAQVLSEVAVTFPEDATRHLAADATKVVVGRGLSQASVSEARHLTGFLTRLAPADRLLTRDAQRFVQKLQPPPGPLAVQPGSLPPRQTANRKMLPPLRVLRTFMLPQSPKWGPFVAAGPVFYAIPTQANVAMIMQCTWHGSHTWCVGDPLPHTPNALVYCPTPSQLWILALPHGAIQMARAFPPAAQTLRVEITMPFLPAHALAIACDEQNNAWVLHGEPDTSGLVLSVYDPTTGRMLATHSLPADLLAGLEIAGPGLLPIPMVARSNHVYIALGARVLTFAYGRLWESTTLPHPVTHLVASDPLTRLRVAAGMEVGGVVFTDGLESHPLAEGLDFPLLAFSRGGTLLAAAKAEIRLYRMSGKRPDYRGTCTSPGLDAATIGAAVLPTDRLDEIAFISPNGEVRMLALGM